MCDALAMDQQEVTHQQFLASRDGNGYGYEKINALCRLAREILELEWVWIDTICIDKKSSAELSEAINAMFEWYRSAYACFVFLPDVHPLRGGQPPSGPRKFVSFSEEAFLASVWFTRGWTLQELIAPRYVILFNSAFNTIGVKENVNGSVGRALTKIIEKASGISSQILTNNTRAIAKTCVAQRMSWAASRQTNRPEDLAYCLLGIFDVNMPLLYGEGASNAFRPLQSAIIAKSTDESIFAWASDLRQPYSWSGMLAASPAVFKNCGEMRVGAQPRKQSTYAITQRGLELSVPVLRRICKITKDLWVYVYPLWCSPLPGRDSSESLLKIWVQNAANTGPIYTDGYKQAWRSGLVPHCPWNDVESTITASLQEDLEKLASIPELWRGVPTQTPDLDSSKRSRRRNMLALMPIPGLSLIPITLATKSGISPRGLPSKLPKSSAGPDVIHLYFSQSTKLGDTLPELIRTTTLSPEGMGGGIFKSPPETPPTGSLGKPH